VRECCKLDEIGVTDRVTLVSSSNHKKPVRRVAPQLLD
jgi:hypothetical protein